MKSKLTFSFKQMSFLSLMLIGLAAPLSAAPILENGSFENSSVTSLLADLNAFQYAGIVNAPGWAFTGLAGISRDNTHWKGATNSGDYFAFLQQASTINQTFTTDRSYVLQISFDLVDRPVYSNNQIIEIRVDDILRTTINPTANWSTYVINDLAIGAGTHTLEFRGIYTAADATSYLDNVQMSAVPEPTTLALLGIGIVGLGAARRRKAA